MNSVTTLNHNVAECLHRINHFGGSTIRNVCSGADAYVPWGTLDWALACGLSALMAAVAAMVIGLSFAMLRDIL